MICCEKHVHLIMRIRPKKNNVVIPISLQEKIGSVGR